MMTMRTPSGRASPSAHVSSWVQWGPSHVAHAVGSEHPLLFVEPLVRAVRSIAVQELELVLAPESASFMGALKASASSWKATITTFDRLLVPLLASPVLFSEEFPYLTEQLGHGSEKHPHLSACAPSASVVSTCKNAQTARTRNLVSLWASPTRGHQAAEDMWNPLLDMAYRFDVGSTLATHLDSPRPATSLSFLPQGTPSQTTNGETCSKKR